MTGNAHGRDRVVRASDLLAKPVVTLAGDDVAEQDLGVDEVARAAEADQGDPDRFVHGATSSGSDLTPAWPGPPRP